MQKPRSSKPRRHHGLIMLICCLVPILLIFALIKFGISSRGMFLLLILLCPLGHILMMRGGHHGHNRVEGGEKKDGRE